MVPDMWVPNKHGLLESMININEKDQIRINITFLSNAWYRRHGLGVFLTSANLRDNPTHR